MGEGSGLFGLTTLQIAVTASLLAAGGTVAGAILATSGPLSNDGSHAAVGSVSPAATASVPPASASAIPTTPGSGPSATATATAAVSQYQAGFVLQPSVPVDFDRLPPIDTSAWQAARGPAGKLSLTAPPDWKVVTSAVLDRDGQVVGDAISVYKPIAGDIDVGSATPGWVKVDLVTASQPVPISSADEVPEQQAELHRTFGGRPVVIEAYQYGRSTRFPDNFGQVVLIPNTRGSDGTYLVGAAWTWLPADAQDLSTAMTIMESATIQ